MADSTKNMEVLGTLKDVRIGSPIIGQVLSYDTQGFWSPVTVNNINGVSYIYTNSGSGQILVFQGSTVVNKDPFYKLVVSGTASNVTSIDFTGLTYAGDYLLRIRHCYPATTANPQLVATTETSGTNWNTTATSYSYSYLIGAGLTFDNSTASIFLHNTVPPETIKSPYMADIVLKNTMGVSAFSTILGTGMTQAGGITAYATVNAGKFTANTTALGWRFKFSTGNVSICTYQLFEIHPFG